MHSIPLSATTMARCFVVAPPCHVKREEGRGGARNLMRSEVSSLAKKPDSYFDLRKLE